MIINHNLNAMNAHRNITSLTTNQGKAMEKLNSGQRINRASDDAAGLAISEKMRSQIRGLNQASRNAQDGISMIQTAEGALSETQAIGHRMRELAIQSANGIYTDEDRKLIDQEFTELKKEIDRIANETEFNGSKLLNGDRSGKFINVSSSEGKNGNWKYINIDHTNNGLPGKVMTAVFANAISKEEVKKLGEGTFEIRVYIGTTNGKTNSTKYVEKYKDLNAGQIKLELVDNSRFNGYKEYVMDEVIIKNEPPTQKVKLGEIELNLKNLNSGGITDTNLTNTANEGKHASYKIIHTLDDTKKVDGTKLQVGANENQNISFDIDFMRARELGLGGMQIDTTENAQDAIGRIDKAITLVSEQRSALGATQNRLEHTITSTDNTAENMQAAESRIRDVDMAKEMMNLTKLNILQQASQAMLSQANQAPQQVLSLLK